MKNISTYIILLILIMKGSGIHAQYISKVFEYVPAPGQYINTSWGDLEAAQSLVGTITGHISLGSFGGYVIFKFENAVENHPDNPYGVDFSIFGNASNDWSEPGVVWVMQDENNNSLPDDSWYELAGSDYWFSSTIHDYEVSYTRPDDTLSNILWNDNYGNSGYIEKNSFHEQDYYPSERNFASIPQDSYSLKGTLIVPALDFTDPTMEKSYVREFGYADNRKKGDNPYTLPEDPYSNVRSASGGDPFDISWAVDSTGKYQELQSIDFIKIQSACQASSKVLGELSTEILFAVDIPEYPGFDSNYKKQIIIKDFPPVIKGSAETLEAYVFYKGRKLDDEEISWSFSNINVELNQNSFSLAEAGDLTITATLLSDQSVSTSITTFVDPNMGNEADVHKEIKIYPIPVYDNLFIQNLDNYPGYIIRDISGKVCMSGTISGYSLNLSDLQAGMYFLQLDFRNSSGEYKGSIFTRKIVKK